jgi:hypothetical protein
VSDNVFYSLAAGTALIVGAGHYNGVIKNNVFCDIADICLATTGGTQYAPVAVIDNIAVNCTTFIVNGYADTAAQCLFVKNNAYYNVTNVVTDADWYGSSATLADGFVALSADPFGNVANGDFTISNTADTRAKLIGQSAFGTDLGALGHDPDYPILSNVLETDTVNGVPGTLAEDNVLTTAGGDYVSPSTSIVKDGEFYGPDSSYEGEYVGGGGGGGLLQGNKRGNKQ